MIQPPVESPGRKNLLKTIEVVLTDGLIIASAFLLDTLNLWERFDFPLNTAADLESIEGMRYAIPPYIPFFSLVVVLVLIYSMARKSKPSNPLLQIFYGLGLMGIIWTCAGIPALMFNSLVMALPGMLVGYIVAMKHEGGDKGLTVFANRIYDHPSRIIILPVATYFFISGTEYVFHTRISTDYSMILVVMVYLPVRLMLMFKEPYKPYHFIIMLAAFAIFSYGVFVSVNASPAAPVWHKMGGYLGDTVRVLKSRGSEAVVYARVGSGGDRIPQGTYLFVTVKTPGGVWKIDDAKTTAYIKEKETGGRQFRLK